MNGNWNSATGPGTMSFFAIGFFVPKGDHFYLQVCKHTQKHAVVHTRARLSILFLSHGIP